MAAQKLNLLHILLAASSAMCLGFALWEIRQRTISLKRNFWACSWFAVITALMLVFFQAGMKHSVWQIWAALPVGLGIGALFGLTMHLRVDRSWSIPRPPGARRMTSVAIVLVAMTVVEIAGAAIGPDALVWRFYAAIVAMGCSGIIVGRALAVMVRVRIKLG